jgi:flagellar basal body-associated protein FliL
MLEHSEKEEITKTKKMDTGILIIVLVTVLMLGSCSYSYVSDFSSLSVVDHHKSFVKKTR